MTGHNSDGKPGIYCDTESSESEVKIFYLDHSCDDWLIGGTKQAQDFVNELQKLIDENPYVEDYSFTNG